MIESTAPTVNTTPDTLTFKHTPVRIALVDGVPYFALEDICAAVGWSFDYCAATVSRASFPAYGKIECWEETDDGLKDATALSPIGVWLLTVAIDPHRGQGLAAWAKRGALLLCPDANLKDPRMYLTLSETGELPTAPTRFSGRWSEWLDLKDSDEYWNASLGQPLPDRKEMQRTLREAAEKARLEAQA